MAIRPTGTKDRRPNRGRPMNPARTPTERGVQRRAAMKPTMWTGLGMVAFVAAVAGSWPIGGPQTLAAQGGTAARPVPQFQVDPTWPKLPAKWVLGLVSN